MQLNGLTTPLGETAAFRDLADRIRAGENTQINVIRAARPYLVSTLADSLDVPILFITGRIKRAYNVVEQLPVWMPEAEARILRFGEPVPQFYERAAWGEEVVRSRVETLAALMDDDAPEQPLVVTSARALMQRTLPVGEFRRRTLRLKVGERHAIDQLLADLVALGYESAPIVLEQGTFSRRGGVLDIFPVARLEPIRVDFFDDEIETIKVFDPSTQRSAEKLGAMKVTPARESLPIYGEGVARWLESWFKTHPPSEDDRTGAGADHEKLILNAAFPLLEHYLPYMVTNPVSLLDYAPDNALIVVEDMDELRDMIDDLSAQADARRDDHINKNMIPPDMPAPYVDWALLADELSRRTVLELSNSADPADAETLPAFDGLFRPGGRFGGQIRRLLTDLRTLSHKGDRVVVVTEQAERLKQIWYEQDASEFIPTLQTLDQAPNAGAVIFVNGTMQEGWTADIFGGEWHLLTDAEIFGWSKPEPRRRKTAKRHRTPESDYADWQENDFVVHVDYGVGQFGGLVHRTVDGNEREYLLIRYDGSDRVFVPIHQADRLSKYIGADDSPPSLSKLGKVEWSRIKSRAKKAVEEEARELLTLYAERASTSGYAFSPDSHWQHELEASFPYVETEDQLRSLREVKADMETSHPMDRLICGDVGYGKTEVALRAAFKAVTDGKQVAVLVPTTVLAQQHYETFSNRLAPFPLNIEVMSRFKSKDELSRALPKVAAGEIDIVIGTHRILSNDVTWHDLGLVIIDEEQRFGVKHKEHFKALRKQVDVLTLTATPIPRTLYMSMAGVRDISMIQTPPEERLPVVTHVGRFDESLVRQAILRELERGGQIFIVHNRVNTIESLRERIEEIVPEARVVVGHGQMAEHQLERVMSAFGKQQFDILIATTIIESGIDIPNANTLIIDHADYLGLAQLYQLRGRVGRGAQQGYAYFFHPRKVTEEARARLDTLAENTHLGAGMDIAMRDLEIRGAGDILSTKQTGHVSAIGLHLYTQLLHQAIRKLKGEISETPESAEEEKGIIIDLPLPAYVPGDWIPEIALRLQIYRRIGGLANREQVEAIRAELLDRFGQLPTAVDNLLYQIEVKLLGQAAHATHILARDGKLQIKLPYLGEINRAVMEHHLGEDVEVSRVAVIFPLDRERRWKLRLLDALAALRVQDPRTSEGMGL